MHNNSNNARVPLAYFFVAIIGKNVITFVTFQEEVKMNESQILI